MRIFSLYWPTLLHLLYCVSSFSRSMSNHNPPQDIVTSSSHPPHHFHLVTFNTNLQGKCWLWSGTFLHFLLLNRRNHHQSLQSQSGSAVRHVFTARLPSADWHCSQPRPVSKLHSTLSPLTLHKPSHWSAGHIQPSDWPHKRGCPKTRAHKTQPSLVPTSH